MLKFHLDFNGWNQIKTLIYNEQAINPCPAEPDIPYLCKQCRFRSVGF